MKWIFFILLLTSCGSSDMVLGGVFHLTGDAATWGVGELQGAQLAIEDVNNQGGIGGVPLRLLVEDGQTNFQETQKSLAFLASQQVDAVIGPTFFGQLSSLAKDSQTVFVSPSAGAIGDPNIYFYSLWPTASQEVFPLFSYFSLHQIDRVSVVYSQNDYTLLEYEAFVQLAQEHDVEIVHVADVSSDETDFRTIIAKLPDVPVVTFFAFYPSQGRFSTQLYEQGFSQAVFSTSNVENKELLTFPSVEGVIYTFPSQSEAELIFQRRYYDRFGELPGPSSAYAYDAVMLLAEGLRQGKDDIASFLSAISYEGITGVISFEESRRTEKAFILKTVRNGTFSSLRSYPLQD